MVGCLGWVFLEACTGGWLVGWLVAWVVGRLIGWLVGQSVCSSVSWLVGLLIGQSVRGRSEDSHGQRVDAVLMLC